MTANERLAEIKQHVGSNTEWELVAALEAVLELHQPDAFTECGNCHTGQGEAHPYPCPTVEAVNEALGGES